MTAHAIARAVIGQLHLTGFLFPTFFVNKTVVSTSFKTPHKNFVHFSQSFAHGNCNSCDQLLTGLCVVQLCGNHTRDETNLASDYISNWTPLSPILPLLTLNCKDTFLLAETNETLCLLLLVLTSESIDYTPKCDHANVNCEVDALACLSTFFMKTVFVYIIFLNVILTV